MMIFLRNTFLLVVMMPLFWACSDEENVSGKATLNIRLIDAPGDYQQVNVDIQSVEIHRVSDDSISSWETLNLLEPGIYNLLDFTNGNDTLLVSEDVEVGRISQIRLILGSENTIMIDSVLHDLKTPSAQQSGLKLKVNTDLATGITYSMILDFDASRSVVEAGKSGKYILKPVIRVLSEAIDGGIMGVVFPDTVQAAVYAIANEDSIGTMTNGNGAFKILGLEAGTYDVVAVPEDSITPVSVTGVNVEFGVITEIDTLYFE